MFVHVSGAVVDPGLLELPSGSRVGDAVEAAGGLADDAASDAVNLARILVDGEQVHVPREGEQSGDAAARQAIAAGTAAEGETAKSGLVDINVAGEAELRALPGIGESIAAKIVADRKANGPFESIEDLKRVSGIGDKRFEAISGLICV